MNLKSFLALCLFCVNALIATDINTIRIDENCSDFLPKAHFFLGYNKETNKPIISSKDLTENIQLLPKPFDSRVLSIISICGNIYKFLFNDSYSVLLWNRSNNMIITRRKLDTMLCATYYMEKYACINIYPVYPVISLETNQYVEFDFKDFYEKMELSGIKQVINIYYTDNNINDLSIKNLSVIFNQNVESVSIITPATVHTIWSK